MRYHIAVCLVAIFLSVICPFEPYSVLAQEKQGAQKATVVFLVRHAEKLDASRDPELSEPGKKRAEQLAILLRDAKIDSIHSTDFKRTQSTGKPLADRLDIAIQSYNPRDLVGFAKQLKLAGGRHLVVGHSNTTPKLVEVFGGQPLSPIEEKGEYDRIYMVSISPDGSVASVLFRYGKPFVKADGH